MTEPTNLSGNSISRVWREGNYILKRQPKYMADNERYALTHPRLREYVPVLFGFIDEETIRIEFVRTTPIIDTVRFMAHYQPVLDALKAAGLRHGDLSEYAVLARGNRPVITDWAESRTWDDPRPDKRREGDAYWLKRTMEKLCNLKI